MANKKAEILTMDGQVVSPITLATNVLLDDGRTAQDLLDSRDESMFSPTTTTSSSISKVGQGDNVDFSENVIDGAYKSCVLKGRSMVNCIQEPSSKDVVLPYEFADGRYVTINDTKESGALGVELKGQTLVNLVSQGQILSPYQQACTNASLVDNGDHYTATVTPTDSTGYMRAAMKYSSFSKFEVGKKYTFVTDERFLKIAYIYYNGKFYHFNSYKFAHEIVGQTVDFISVYYSINCSQNVPTTYSFPKNIVILEGDYTNVDIPYFEGMQSVQAPSVTTVGKNLFDMGDVEFNYAVGNATPINSNYVSSNFIKVKPSTVYAVNDSMPVVYGFNKNKEDVKELKNTKISGTFTTPASCHYVRIRNYTPSTDHNSIIKLAQLEESPTPTTYEPYKSTTLTTSEEVVLRGIGNVKDTLNLQTGELTQRIGEIVLDGSEDEVWGTSVERDSKIIFYTLLTDCRYSNYVVQTDKLPKNSISDVWGVNDIEGAYVNDAKSLLIAVLKTRLSSNNVAGFKQYLQSNPITVQYELATPITSTVSLTFTNQDSQPTTKLSTYNTTTHINASSQEGSLIPTLSHVNPTYPVILKPSTKYSIVANSYSNGHTNSAVNFNLGGATVSTTVGNRVTTLTTPSTLTGEKLVMSGRGNKLNNVMIIEGDVVGDEPYFEGMCDVDMPVVTNVGKNLFDITTIENSLKDGAYHYIKVPIKKGATYVVSINSSFEKTAYINVAYTTTPNGNGNIVGWLSHPKVGHYIKTIQSANNDYLYINWSEGSTLTREIYKQLLSTLQLEESTTPTPYEPYKSNILSCNSEVILRSLPNGVCDTLDLMTGEYVQRIGEYTYDGDENWVTWDNTSLPNEEREVLCFRTTTWDKQPKQSTNPSLCDKLVCWSGTNSTHPYYSVNKELFVHASVNNSVRFGVSILKTKASTLEEFKTHLQQNPVTVQYELATPITTTIDLKQHPFAYKDGYVVLTSSSEEVSLTPTIEYSLIANRLGQIQSNQKLVEKQQAQIDELESMVVANLVNTQYQQALNEIKLGVK